MKTTLEVDQDLLRQAKQALGTSTIRETVEKSLQSVVRQKALNELADSLGTFDFGLTVKDLRKQRRTRQRRGNAPR